MNPYQCSLQAERVSNRARLTGLGFLVIDLCVSADVEAFTRAMQGSREESKEKKDEEDMSLD